MIHRIYLNQIDK